MVNLFITFVIWDKPVMDIKNSLINMRYPTFTEVLINNVWTSFLRTWWASFPHTGKVMCLNIQQKLRLVEITDSKLALTRKPSRLNMIKINNVTEVINDIWNV